MHYFIPPLYQTFKTKKMKNPLLVKSLALSIMLCSAILFSNAQAPNIKWQKTIGGSGADANNFGKITELSNGCYMMVGSTFSTDGTFSSNNGNENAFVIKFNSSGHVLWAKTYGGSDADMLNGVVENNDGTFTIAGYTYSNDGDVSGNHGDRDAWLIKISSKGNLLSSHCYGGSGDDVATDMIKTPGNTYTFSGWSFSNDGDVSGNHGGQDAWVAKINQNGNLIWSKPYGGSGDEGLSGLTQTASSKILIAGFGNSSDGDMNGYHGGDADAFALSLNQNGTIIWSKCYGGSGTDYSAFGIGVAKDGSLLIPGTSNSTDGDVTGNHGELDSWVTKINNSNGNVTWSKCFGTAISEAGYGILTMPNGDLVLLGISGPTDDIFGDNLSDALAIRMTSNGNQLWSKTFGGSDFDDAEDGIPTNDGGILLLCHTYSNDGDVTNQQGDVDLWLVKLDDKGSCHNHREANQAMNNLNKNFSYTLYPNPISNSATISFSLLKSQKVSLEIFDLNGRLITILANNAFEAGEHSVEWNSEDIKSGIYFLQIQTGDFLKTEKVIITK